VVIDMSNYKYPAELRERAVRLYRETSPTLAIVSVARKLNVGPEALRNWIRQDEADRGDRADRPTTEERCRISLTRLSSSFSRRNCRTISRARMLGRASWRVRGSR
jgi:transposase